MRERDEMDEPKTYRSGETFTVTSEITPEEGDMITTTDTRITYVFEAGEWRPVTFPPGSGSGRRG